MIVPGSPFIHASVQTPFRPDIVHILTDCTDSNALARTQTTWQMAFRNTPLVTWKCPHPNTMALNMIDALALPGKSKLIFLNAAPRGTCNCGAPFGHIWLEHRNTLIVSTLGSHLRELRRVLEADIFFYPFDTEEIFAKPFWARRLGIELMRDTQFRSCYWAPYFARHICEGREIPIGGWINDDAFPWAGLSRNAVALIDSFGNAKTLLIYNHVKRLLDANKHPKTKELKLETRLGTFTLYDRLGEIPKGEIGIVKGSSGMEDMGFNYVELILRGGSAAKKLNLKVGDSILKEDMISNLLIANYLRLNA